MSLNEPMTSDRPAREEAVPAAPVALTVWFDGGCPLCRREIALFRRLDRRGAIRFEDISTQTADCPIDRARLLARFHAQERGQPIVSGAAAFAAMWRAIPLLRPLGELARLPVLLWAFEKAYLGFLKIRPSLQRRLR
jgi:predicted DCC family thiol-disulfide oxidoreductase YuxK